MRAVLLAAVLASPIGAEERTERFDRDPGWDGHNNRTVNPEPRTVVQNFGFSDASHAGGKPGEMGGFISPAAEPAYYAKRIPDRTFDDVLTASGTLACTGQPFHVLVGFFNNKTVNEWRTPNTIALRLSGRGDVFYAWLEYATSRWRAGGDSPRGFPTELNRKTGRQELKGFPASGSVYKWSLRYDPTGNNGAGVVTATIGDETAICHLSDGHRADGATFNRFGLLTVMKSADAGGELWLDDVTVNGEIEDFRSDPDWEGFQNRRTYASTNVRPWFDFGYSPTQHAGGQSSGELGGQIFRGDCRYPHTLAYYGDRLGELNLERPLRASGKVSLRRGVTDSTVLVGFFHSRDSMTVNPSQDSGLPKNFLGVVVDGPSREGFYFAPAYRNSGDGRGHATDESRPPHIHPDGKPHDWTLEYTPSSGSDGDGGSITVTLDGAPVRIKLQQEHKAAGARFDRFGIITTWVDGNGQDIYFDDLKYTCSHGAEPESDRNPVRLDRSDTTVRPEDRAGRNARRTSQAADAVWLATLAGHTSSVMSVAFSPDSSTLASGSRDKSVRLWDVATGRLAQTLNEHTADVYAVAFSPHDPGAPRLASASADKTVRLWDVATGKVSHTLTAHDDVVRSVAFLPDGIRLVSGSADRTVRLWNLSRGAREHTFYGHEGQVRSVAVSRNGKLLASGGTDGSARLWDASTGDAILVLRGHAGSLEAVAFSPDGSIVATSSSDSTVRLWDTRTGKLRQALESHVGEVDSIAFAPDSQALVSGSKDRTIKVWDLATGHLRRTVAAHADRVESLAFSRDGNILASGSGGQDATIKLWNAAALVE